MDEKKLYLFDFDGTLTNKDTLFDFLQFSFPHKYKKVFIKFIPLFILVRFKIFDAGKIKQKFISQFLKGKTRSELEELAQCYFESRKNTIIRPKALEYIRALSREPNKYIVTASLDLWVKPFAKYLGLRLISTEAEYINGVFNGKFATPNCNNKQKVVRIINEIQLAHYSKIYAFGDSKGDKNMLELATDPFYRHFE
ncbi:MULTISPECIES: HAD-IB family hydrolase [unclassified Apibacter]|uniref:HAD-IB family hydrolase n=1 Tax=unclassified Apibacter TaxID=2630820 RepID=UPI00135EA17E|nr:MULTISPECIES: HAD-IB family hydrolase [unclassified Apibacter]MXP06337.1 HAD-IB family hydrolase [Apibacter sp. B3546]MXP11984.1 HAD-IB family hydrolase [Apibacter sp. B3239]